MKVYLAGMGANDSRLAKAALDYGKKFRRLISFAYKSDAEKIIKLKREGKNETKGTVKRTFKCKARNRK